MRRPGGYGKDEIGRLASFMSPDSTVIEVGSFAGASASMFLKAKNVRKLYCIDFWARQRIENKFDKTMKKQLESGRVSKIKASSITAHNMFSDYCADMIYIDAAHDYDSVYCDILAYWPKLKYGGIMSGHDYITEETDRDGCMEKHEGVKRAVDELFGNFELIGWTWYLRKETETIR